MTIEEFLQALKSHDFPPVFTIAQWPNTACRFIKWSEEHEGFAVLAPIGSNQGIVVDIDDITLVEGDVCTCGDLGCNGYVPSEEWNDLL